MVQSVQTLTNNSIILMSQNDASTTISSSNLIGLKDARCYLRNSLGDIYLAVENALESFKMKNDISHLIMERTVGPAAVNNSTGQISTNENNKEPFQNLVNNEIILDDEDEDEFYSPDEEAIDSLISKWKNERINNDNEICQLFQLALGQQGQQKNVNHEKEAISQPPKPEVDSLRRYLIKKYFGSEDASLTSGSDSVTADASFNDTKVNSTHGQANDVCVMKKQDGKLNTKDEKDVNEEGSKSDTNCQVRVKENEHPKKKPNEMLHSEENDIKLNETTGKDKMCKDNNFDDRDDEDDEKDVNFSTRRRRKNNNDVDEDDDDECNCRTSCTFTLDGVDDVTADDSKITTTTSSKSSITSEKCTISDGKSKKRKEIQFADGEKDANRELTLQGKQLHRRNIQGKNDSLHSGHLHQQQQKHLDTNAGVRDVNTVLKYDENLDDEVNIELSLDSQDDEDEDEDGDENEIVSHKQSSTKSASELANNDATTSTASSTSQLTTKTRVNTKSLSITDDTFNGHTCHKSSVKSTTNGLLDPALSSEHHQSNLQIPSVSSLDAPSHGSSLSDLTDPVASALLSFEKEFRQLYECELCTLDFEIEKMVSMLACEHRACENCIKTYLTIQIRERQCVIIQCPFCTEPSFDPVKDDDEIFTYLSLMDELIKNLLDVETYNLFQRKVRDRSLMKDPSFRWCINCSSGFVASPRNSPIGINSSSTATCPDCSTVVCIKCNQEWLPQHENVSCEVYGEWKRANDPEFAVKQLNVHLSQFGIDCPSCKFHYELARGGCMHFHCVQCGYDFCGGCYKRFVTGSECSISSYCDKMGLHAHHPRNCLFYLRDKEPNVLKQLLDQNNITYNVKFEPEVTNGSIKAKVCSVMEQKRISNGYKDEICGRSTEFAGLCRLHYIEYLGQLIFKNNVDPIDIFEVYELELVLKRSNVQVSKSLDKNSSSYKEALIEVCHFVQLANW